MTNPAYRETFWNPRVFSMRGLVFIAAIIFGMMVIGFFWESIPKVAVYEIEGGAGYRVHQAMDVMVAAIAATCLGVLLWFRRGAWFLLLIPILLCIGLLYSSSQTYAAVTDQQYRWVNGWGEETVVELSTVQRVIFETNKEYAGRRGVQVKKYVHFYSEAGESCRISYSRSSVTGPSLDAVLIKLEERGVPISKRTTGAAR